MEDHYGLILDKSSVLYKALSLELFILLVIHSVSLIANWDIHTHIYI